MQILIDCWIFVRVILVFECGFQLSKGVWSVHGVLALGMGLGCIFVRVCDSGDEDSVY